MLNLCFVENPIGFVSRGRLCFRGNTPLLQRRSGREQFSLATDIALTAVCLHHEFDETDQAAWHLVLYENGHAAGCCRLFTSDNPDVYILGRLAVRKSCRGRQYGERLVQGAEGWLRGRHVKRLALSAQVRVRPFYEKLGYTASGDEYLDEYCPHTRMEKELTE